MHKIQILAYRSLAQSLAWPRDSSALSFRRRQQQRPRGQRPTTTAFPPCPRCSLHVEPSVLPVDKPYEHLIQAVGPTFFPCHVYQKSTGCRGSDFLWRQPTTGTLAVRIHAAATITCVQAEPQAEPQFFEKTQVEKRSSSTKQGPKKLWDVQADDLYDLFFWPKPVFFFVTSLVTG